MTSLASISDLHPNEPLALKSWLVRHRDGTILNVMEVAPTGKEEPHINYVIVEAYTKADAEEKARKKVYNLYCARKKKEAKLRHQARGECACGRPADRVKKDGTPFKTCSVCSARQPSYNEKYKGRIEDGTVGKEPRDEVARVAKNLERQRDRRKEIRVEVLIEVRKRFWDAEHMKDFASWLDENIKELTTV